MLSIQLGHPPQPDIATYTSYTSVLSLHKSAANTLKSFATNAKHNSLRSSIATHLTAHRYLHPSITSVKPLKAPKQHISMVLDFWN
jgi:hypothetical protein